MLLHTNMYYDVLLLQKIDSEEATALAGAEMASSEQTLVK